ncbi:MAG: hypothetical protein H7226_04170 [Salinibacterium sp.]|nr:hypothetical protein [Salinibacterium sp.]
MRSLHDHKTALAVYAGLTLVGALAGCSATTDIAAPPAPSADSTTPPAAPASGAATYTDGSYTESGSYQSPNGTESVDVTITLAADVITAVTVVGNGDSRDSQRYQGQFIAGIAAEVVGKNIDSIGVTKVAGSSLTSGGFNSAVDAIKADAAS